MAVAIDHAGVRVLVTGAGAGIGREIARWFAMAGADVAVLDARAEHAEQVADELSREYGIRCEAVVGDARDDDRLVAMVNESADRLGGLDVAVNNIGMMGVHGSAPWLSMTPTQVRDVVEQNLIITAVSCQVEAQLMVAQGRGGVILNTSSGETTRPAPNMAGYGAAKAGINHLTQTLAVELGPHGIRVNAIAPGTTMTENVKAAFTDEHYAAVVAATPLRRETEPEELGRLSIFLASDLARCITGPAGAGRRGCASVALPPTQHHAAWPRMRRMTP